MPREYTLHGLSCKHCRFWAKSDDIWGECHRRAPAPLHLHDKAPVRWPMTRSNDGCGEFEASLEVGD